MAEDYRLTENQIVPMDHKRAVQGERLTYDTSLPMDEQPEKVFNINTGFTTVVETPSYGLVRERSYKVTPDE